MVPIIQRIYSRDEELRWIRRGDKRMNQLMVFFQLKNKNPRSLHREKRGFNDLFMACHFKKGFKFVVNDQTTLPKHLLLLS